MDVVVFLYCDAARWEIITYEQTQARKEAKIIQISYWSKGRIEFPTKAA
jgi:hypothetical protein